jgi:predicted DNA-binding transcriptional regulator AlpA
MCEAWSMNTNPTINGVSATGAPFHEENKMPPTITDATDLTTLDPLLTRFDLERLLQVGERTIRHWVSLGTFPRPIKLGGTHRWRLEDVRSFLAQLREADHAIPAGLDAKKPGERAQDDGCESSVTATPVSTRVDSQGK